MKITSKSILSPGRGGVRDPPTSLSTSLSRRLKNSGSIKGGASPAMFPTATKKRGAFENNPEPSSPKVTCIGQVRVRGRGKKKQAKKLRTLSRTSTTHTSGEVSFRTQDHRTLHGFCSKGQNVKESLNLGSKGGQSYSQSQDQDCLHSQRSWVHFPVTVCEALRAFGSEFSCLIPCRTGKEEKQVVSNDGDRQGGGSCGKLFTRWLVAVQDGEGGGERDIELVVGDEEDEDYYEDESVVRKTRRHVFEDLEIINGRIEGHVDEGRVSICVPPKNALLLMRCRSDPVKNEALCNRSWEPSGGGNEEDDEEFVDCESRIRKELEECEATGEVGQQQVLDEDQENVSENKDVQQDEVFDNMQQDEANQDQFFDNVQLDEANKVQVFDNMQLDEANKVQVFDNVPQDEANKVQVFDNVTQDETNKVQVFDNVTQDEANKVQVFDNVPQDEANKVQVFDNVQQEEADQELDIVQQEEAGQDQEFNNVLKDEVQEHDSVQKYEVGQDQEHEQTEVKEESFYLVSLFEEIVDQDYEIQEQDEAHEEDEVAETVADESTTVTNFAETREELVNEAQEHNTGILDGENEVKEKSGSEEVLPECLLMMMREPKLSINISKETWVCSTDFIKRKSNKRKPPPLPPLFKPSGGDEISIGAAATVNDGFPPVLPQSARSSCSLPMVPSMATVLEQKLASAVGYEPFVLTRCKSEPVKTVASKLLLLPESCVLENRKLEGQSRVTFGLGF
ncbi:uncharacterized protein LOC143586604 [Bidens hawaiensis]|uniref:uncharacterized protein LOC143586604 n=1 Tax=Bidens hawaiensis TaxID=980011 RepID=UPI0040491A5D